MAEQPSVGAATPTAAAIRDVSPEVRRAALALAVRRYVDRLRADPRAIGALVGPALGNVFFLYLPPLVIGRILRRAAAGEAVSVRAFAPSIAAFAGLWLIGELWWRLGIHLLNRVDARGVEALYTDGLDELLAKDLAFFHDSFGGSLSKRLISYAKLFEDFVDTLAFNVVGNVLPLIVASVVLWQFDPRLVVALVGLITLSGLMILPLIRRRQRLVDAREAASAHVAGRVADTITNIDAVRSFGAEQRESDAHRRSVTDYRRKAVASWDYQNLRIDAALTPMAVLINTLGLVLALSLGRTGGVEVIFVTFAYYVQATRIVFEFNQVFRQLESALTEAAQFTELILDPPTLTDPVDPAELAPADAAVAFVNVCFGYPSAAAPLFEQLDLHIASGEKVGFVGRSGGGKTTLTRLLLRHMDIDAGAITIGGQDIRSVRQHDLRSQLAYVPQDPVMFHRSLRENIAFGRPDATDDDVCAAAAAAHADAFIAALPMGFETLVGERGVKLSGGQRQRVAIARAILRDAPILVLDEATSALDSESEALIQDALLHLLEGRTALVVAHRLSTVQRMDRLVVLDGGRIEEQGTHHQLLANDGTYAALWRRQAGGFLAEERTNV